MIGHEQPIKRNDVFNKRSIKKIEIKGTEEKMNGHPYQCTSEPGQKPSQFKKTTLEIRDFVRRTFDSQKILKRC